MFGNEMLHTLISFMDHFEMDSQSAFLKVSNEIIQCSLSFEVTPFRIPVSQAILDGICSNLNHWKALIVEKIDLQSSSSSYSS